MKKFLIVAFAASALGLSACGATASLDTPHETQRRPRSVNRTDLVIDESQRQRDVANRVIGEIGRYAGRSFRPGEPERRRREDELAERWNLARQV